MTLDSIRQEHAQLVPGIQMLKEAADLLFLAPPDAARKEAGEVRLFIDLHVLPHARAEERVFYPAVDRVLGNDMASTLMSRDHAEIARLSGDLGALLSEFTLEPLSDAQRHEMRRLLYTIHADLTLHLAKEEEIFVPLLESKLSAEEARSLAVAMEEAAVALTAPVAAEVRATFEVPQLALWHGMNR